MTAVAIATPISDYAANGRDIAPLELRSILLPVWSGKLSVVDNSLRLTEATVRLIEQSLVAPDFDAEMHN